MYSSHHETSHMRCGIELPSRLDLRRHLEIYLFAAENKMKNGLHHATGEMWTRGWEMWKEYSEQITLLDTVKVEAR